MSGSTPSPLPDVSRLSADELRFVWDRLAAAQRHEDDLMSARLQGFVVGTSVLMAAFSQFRDKPYTYIAVALCVLGMALSYAMYRALSPTARTSRSYIQTLKELELAVFPADLGPYATRHRFDQQAFGSRGAVLELLGETLPVATIAVWLVLGLLYFMTNYWLEILP